MKIRSLLIFLALLLASLACNFLLPPADSATPTVGPTHTTAQAAAITSADITHYDIDGKTANDLRRQMNALGPPDGGRRWDAYARWHICWNWPGYGMRDCDLGRATTSLKITVTLPH